MDKNFTNKVTEISSTHKTEEESDAAKPQHNRRIQDGITSKKRPRKMNLNRRHQNSERRGDGDPKYKGPHRRYTIDRRLVTKDRRQVA